MKFRAKNLEFDHVDQNFSGEIFLFFYPFWIPNLLGSKNLIQYYVSFPKVVFLDKKMQVRNSVYYLGMVARAKVQQRSVHMTDIQQNMEIPA